MKSIEIKLLNNNNNQIETIKCHHYVKDSQYHYCCGVKGIKGYDNQLKYPCDTFTRIY